MREFLEAFWRRGGADEASELVNVLSWTQINADGGTMDAAQWEDWRDAVTRALESGDAAVARSDMDR